MAEDNRRVEGCAVWYRGRPSDNYLILDCLWVDPDVGDRAALGAALMQAGHAAFKSGGARILPEYHLFLKPGWQKDSDTCREVEWRRVAAQSAGLTSEIERLRFEWTRDAGIEEPSGRLVCSPEPDDDVFLDVFERVAIGSLDQETRDVVAKLGVHGHARATLACYRGMRGDRTWWRMAYTPNGKLVGFVIPSANEDNPVIGYLGVVPEERGHGYALDLLAEATSILAAHGAERVRADTDTTNLPMAAAFGRARYRNFGVRLIFSAPDSADKYFPTAHTTPPPVAPAAPADLPPTF